MSEVAHPSTPTLATRSRLWLFAAIATLACAAALVVIAVDPGSTQSGSAVSSQSTPYSARPDEGLQNQTRSQSARPDEGRAPIGSSPSTYQARPDEGRAPLGVTPTTTYSARPDEGLTK